MWRELIKGFILVSLVFATFTTVIILLAWLCEYLKV